ncbi:MAG: hypothetical protein ACFFD2_06995 [Promethearchaeota archaeon]
MNVVRFFGPILSEITGHRLMVCSGMIRLALRDMNKDIEMFTMNEIRVFLNHYLKNRLKRAGLSDNEYIIQTLNSELIKKQSLLLMTSVRQKYKEKK